MNTIITSVGLNRFIIIQIFTLLLALGCVLYGEEGHVMSVYLLAALATLNLVLLRGISLDVSRLTQYIELHSKQRDADIASLPLHFLSAVQIKINTLVRLSQREEKHLQSICDEMGFSSKELAQNALLVAEQCEVQGDSTASSASATTEFSQSIEEVSGRIDKTQQAAELGLERCRYGQQELVACIEHIEGANQSIQSTESLLKQLEQKMDSVNTMSQLIREIADQSNLLALNAAIEAARAGEDGRGFGVVAEEVRTLAMRSQESADSIKKQANDVTTSMVAVVEAMAYAVTETQQCKQKVDNSSNSLSETLDEIRSVTDQISGIAAASNQQAIATKEISENLENVATTASQNSYVAKQNAAIANHLQQLTA